MNCPVCETTEGFSAIEPARIEAAGISYSLHRCPRCEVIFAHPRVPAPAQWYEENTWESYYQDKWEFHEFFRRIPRQSGEILDIGCGEGYFLTLAEQRGWNVVGIDFSREAVERARRRVRSKELFPLSLAEFAERFPERKFHAVTIFHVVEHVPDPKGFLTQASALLSEGGYLAFSMPSDRRVDLHYLEREPWDFPPHHLTRWNDTSVRALVSRSGLELVEIIPEPIRLSPVLQLLMMSTSIGVVRRLRGTGDGMGSEHARPSPPAWKSVLVRVLVLLKSAVFLPIAAVHVWQRRRDRYTGHSMFILTRKSRNSQEH